MEPPPRTTFREKLRTIDRSDLLNCLKVACLKHCLCCIPLKIGVAFLFVLQMASLTPFTVYQRSKLSLEFAIIFMILLSLAAICYMWSAVYEKPNFLPLTLYLSIGSLIFHFAVLDVHYAEHQGTKKEKLVDRTFFLISIAGVLNYFYLIWMLHNTYYKMKLDLQKSKTQIYEI